jgi:hypothetical protein
VIDVGELTWKLAAGAAPKSTAIVPLKPEPVMVTAVPPLEGPLGGETLVTAGGEVVLSVAE